MFQRRLLGYGAVGDTVPCGYRAGLDRCALPMQHARRLRRRRAPRAYWPHESPAIPLRPAHNQRPSAASDQSNKQTNKQTNKQIHKQTVRRPLARTPWRAHTRPMVVCDGQQCSPTHLRPTLRAWQIGALESLATRERGRCLELSARVRFSPSTPRPGHGQPCGPESSAPSTVVAFSSPLPFAPPPSACSSTDGTLG